MSDAAILALLPITFPTRLGCLRWKDHDKEWEAFIFIDPSDSTFPYFNNIGRGKSMAEAVANAVERLEAAKPRELERRALIRAEHEKKMKATGIAIDLSDLGL